jgi:23S rRNA (cytosine1962-C5)-methyltransferase
VEDARAFVAREVRRGRRYDGVMLDPPTYGHAPRGGAAWRIEADLADLLAGCAALTGPDPAFFALTAHTTGLDSGPLRAAIAGAFGPTVAGRADVVQLGVRRPDGLRLPAGLAIRWGP